MKDNKKVWYKKGIKKGCEEGQKMMIDIKGGHISVRSDNLAYMMGKMAKDQQIMNAIDEIKKIKTRSYDEDKYIKQCVEIIYKYTGVK